MDWLAKVRYKSRHLCGNFGKAKSPTSEAVCIYALTGVSVPSFSHTLSTQGRLDTIQQNSSVVKYGWFPYAGRAVARGQAAGACSVDCRSPPEVSCASSWQLAKLDNKRAGQSPRDSGLARWFVAQYRHQSPRLSFWWPAQPGLRQGTLSRMPQLVQVLGLRLLGGFGTMAASDLSGLRALWPAGGGWRWASRAHHPPRP
jgi:hypothetical protein